MRSEWKWELGAQDVELWELDAQDIEFLEATVAFVVFDIDLLIISCSLYNRIWFCDIFDPIIKIIFKIIMHTHNNF